MLQDAHGPRTAAHDSGDLFVGEALEKPQGDDLLLIIGKLSNSDMDIVAERYLVTLIGR